MVGLLTIYVLMADRDSLINNEQNGKFAQNDVHHNNSYDLPISVYFGFIIFFIESIAN